MRNKKGKQEKENKSTLREKRKKVRKAKGKTRNQKKKDKKQCGEQDREAKISPEKSDDKRHERVNSRNADARKKAQWPNKKTKTDTRKGTHNR